MALITIATPRQPAATFSPAAAFFWCCCATVLFMPSVGLAQQEEPGSEPPVYSVEELVTRTRPSLAVISVSGRDGRDQGVGTGFVIDPDGLIATNLHVIGDARQFKVSLSDGKELKVTGIHASDRNMDLAIIQVEQRGLTALPLGKLADLKTGAPIVVMGNPHGLTGSVVSGVNSGIREIAGRSMLQLAIPIEPGNSGGPVLDRHGRVYGVVTMKSAVTNNLGFAVDVSALSSLLDKPNPVPIDRWLTIGTMDPRDWTTLFGARWQQRGGRIVAGGSGQGFAGRSLCLSTQELPDLPAEIAVRVKLDDEAGAAGLVFHSDGKHRHYGFYPTAGKMRLTLFEGADVFSWKVLYDQPSPHYRAGEWNTLKVRIEEDRISCFVNDQLVVESVIRGPREGQVGLAKFRNTVAEFRGFQLAKEIPDSAVSPKQAEQLNELLDQLPDFADVVPDQLDKLAEVNTASNRLLLDKVRQLEDQTRKLKQLAADVNTRSVCLQLQKLLQADAGDDEDQPAFDLIRAALLISLLDEEEIEIDAYVRQVDRMVDDIKQTLEEDASEADRLAALDKYLFKDNGFHGSRFDYNHRANSYLNRVISDREGLPISLSVLYLELGSRLGLKIEGVGLPGHFVVRFVPAEGESQLIDVFNEATRLSLDDAKKLAGAPLRPFHDEYLDAVDQRAILSRMIANLLNLARQQDDKERMLRYLEMLLVIDPESTQSRGMRSILRYETGRTAAALADLDWFLEHQPPELDLDRIRQMRDLFQQGRAPR
jgi:regulator of sirC expression with transglutaminase-like and TPR domain